MKMSLVVLVEISIVISGLFHGSFGQKPVMNPKTDVHSLNFGDELRIECKINLDGTIKFSYPMNDKTSESNITKVGSGEYTFVRQNVTRGDTGWYACAEDGVDIDPKILDRNQPDITWTYVYVKVKSNYFVDTISVGIVSSFIGVTTVIPCRPTSPEFDVTVLKNGKTLNLTSNERIYYDSKMGVVITNTTVTDTAHYSCRINVTKGLQSVEYALSVMNLPPMRARKQMNISMIPGKNYTVNCTVNFDRASNFTVTWTRSNGGDIPTMLYVEKPMQKQTYQMVLKNVTHEDEGQYECNIKDSENETFTIMNVTMKAEKHSMPLNAAVNSITSTFSAVFAAIYISLHV